MEIIINNKNKQYYTNINSYLTINNTKINNNNDIIIFKKKLFLKKKNNYFVGNPFLNNMIVIAKIIKIKNKKMHIIKFMRRKNYKKTLGLKQKNINIKIIKIKNKIY